MGTVGNGDSGMSQTAFTWAPNSYTLLVEDTVTRRMTITADNIVDAITKAEQSDYTGGDVVSVDTAVLGWSDDE